jgi:hypothetical protein
MAKNDPDRIMRFAIRKLRDKYDVTEQEVFAAFKEELFELLVKIGYYDE